MNSDFRFRHGIRILDLDILNSNLVLDADYDFSLDLELESNWDSGFLFSISSLRLRPSFALPNG